MNDNAVNFICETLVQILEELQDINSQLALVNSNIGGLEGAAHEVRDAIEKPTTGDAT